MGGLLDLTATTRGILSRRMGRDQRIIDKLRAFERLCIELAADATMPEEPAGSRWQRTIAPRLAAAGPNPGPKGESTGQN